MSEQKHINWLAEQLPSWQQKELITEQQAQAISAQYPAASANNWARLLLSGFGSLVFGLGVILFFAYNWQDMHRLLKLFTIFSALLIANLSALYFDQKAVANNALDFNKNHSAAEGLSLLGTVLFGAAIWLISQIYHIDEHYPNAFMLWGSAALLMAYARQSFIQNLAALFLLSIWGYLEMVDFNQPLYFVPWIILFATGGLFIKLRHERLFALSLCNFLILFAFSVSKFVHDIEGYAIFATGILLINIGFYLAKCNKRSYHIFRSSFTVPGFIIYLFCLYALSFREGADEISGMIILSNGYQTLIFWLSLFISTLLPLFYLYQYFISKKWHYQNTIAPQIIHLISLTAVSIWVFFLALSNIVIPIGFTTILMNILFIVHCIAFIIHGSKIQRGWEVAIGCLLFTLLVFTRYTDLFESLLIRSTIFLILGAGIFIVSNFYQKQKVAKNTKGIAQ